MKKLQVLAKSTFTVLALGTALMFSSCKDECKDVVCQNGGTCTEGICDCPSGYEGTLCETEIRAKFKGTWTVLDNCSQSGTSGYSVSVVNGTALNEVNITNFWGAFTAPVKATVTGNTISVASQQPDNDGWFVSGQGSVSGNTMTWNYTITSPAGQSDVCTATWTK